MFTCFSSEGIEATFLPNFNFYVTFLTKIARNSAIVSNYLSGSCPF